MFTKLKAFILGSLTAFSLLATAVVAPVAVHAADPVKTGLNCGSQYQVTDKDCANNGSDPESSVNNLLSIIINIFSVIVGVVAVIMVIIGGFKFVTSGGDSGQVTSARNTILYAIVGLVVVALAQILVRYVLNRVNNSV